MDRYEETSIINTELIGENINSVVNQVKSLIDMIMDDSQSNCIDYDFFDIKGTVLFYGVPGIGKTAASHNIINYALEKYGLDSYYINTSDIIVSGLGESVHNLSGELNDFISKTQGILFLDEIDRLCVNRNRIDEVSELKRMSIELMRFFDSLNHKSHKFVIACTNVYDQLDDALLRRFSLRYEFIKPTFEEKDEFIRLCFKKLGFKDPIQIQSQKKANNFNTIDDIKKEFREAILSGKIEKLINNFKEEL